MNHLSHIPRRTAGAIDVVVIGAGHAGLAISQLLSTRGVEHVVLERGEVANSWRKERWDSLTLLTPNWQTRLPGCAYDGDDPDGFMTIPEVIDFIDGYAETIAAPVQTDTTVTVHDGQTIVIGGLISDRVERRDSKVPFFGDIPIVGGLFRSESEDRVKTELLIVLTPHVVQSPADFERVEELTEKEVDRLTYPESLKERIKAGEFDLGDGLFDAQGNPIDIDMDSDLFAPTEGDDGS